MLINPCKSIKVNMAVMEVGTPFHVACGTSGENIITMQLRIVQ